MGIFPKSPWASSSSIARASAAVRTSATISGTAGAIDAKRLHDAARVVSPGGWTGLAKYPTISMADILYKLRLSGNHTCHHASLDNHAAALGRAPAPGVGRQHPAGAPASEAVGI